MQKRIVAIIVVALVQFILSWTAFTLSDTAHPGPGSKGWQVTTEVLAFPLVYLSQRSPGFDLFPILMIANAVLWGVGIVSLLYFLRRPHQDRRNAG